MSSSEHVDVLIVGAGLSGIGAACHLRRECPGKSLAILEARDAIGGTWDLFRYPGVRSDSDMFTLGYSFKPWPGDKSLADGDSIREYVRDTAREYGVDQKIRFGHKVLGAEWSSADARWTVHAQRVDTGEDVDFTCSFLYTNAGYYNYDQGFSPEFPGAADYAGTVVHPQHWPADLDYAGKKVVVIGSGATAVTLVPAMAETAEKVTMLQRSPTYVLPLPAIDGLATLLRDKLPDALAYQVVRWKNVAVITLSYQLSRRAPGLMKSVIRKAQRAQLPEGYDIDTHFTPHYNPWDERLCVVPDGDLFKAIRAGRADVVTDRIESFTEKGIRLVSGQELEADVIVTATGLNLQAIGGMSLTVDGEAITLADRVAYRGMMLSGVPNFALTIGYTNASWTLKADLVAQYICRLLNRMDATGRNVATPLPPADGAPLRPLLDNLRSGYIQRGVAMLPKQGPAAPWLVPQNYPLDRVQLSRADLEESMRFTSVPVTAPATV